MSIFTQGVYIKRCKLVVENATLSIYKSQFLFYSYTLAFFPAWFAWTNKLECKRKMKIVFYIFKNVPKLSMFEVCGKMFVVERGP